MRDDSSPFCVTATEQTTRREAGVARARGVHALLCPHENASSKVPAETVPEYTRTSSYSTSFAPNIRSVFVYFKLSTDHAESTSDLSSARKSMPRA